MLWRKSSSYFIFTSLGLNFFFNLSCSASFIEPKLLGLQVVIIIHECTESDFENYISEGIGFALSIQSSYTAATLTFKHNHRDSFHFFRLEVNIWSIHLKKKPDWRDSQFWYSVLMLDDDNSGRDNLYLWYLKCIKSERGNNMYC